MFIEEIGVNLPALKLRAQQIQAVAHTANFAVTDL
jgi:hypothetical protein